MKKVKEAKKLARMYINAVGLDDAQKGLAELASVNEMARASKEFRTFLQAPQFTDEERAAVFGELKAKLNLSDSTVKILSRAAEVGAASALGEIISFATRLYLERKQKAMATVITPAPIEAAYEERIRQAVQRLTGKEVDVRYDVDPTLLGGVLVKVGSTMFDSSIKGQLRLLKDELIKE